MFTIKYWYIYIILLGLYSYFNIIFTGADNLLSTLDVHGLRLYAVLQIVVIFVWEGNRIIQIILDKNQQKFNKNYQPLIIQFLSSLLIVALATSLIIGSVIVFNLKVEPLWHHTKLLLGFGFRINLFLNSINAIVYFLNLSKQNKIQAETFKKKSIEAQFEALRNQINPHFLFNSLNVLSTLVYKDAKEADQFIQQLAKVYRYLINNQDKNIISLKEELNFINSYIYLLSIRFKNNLIIQNKIEEDTADRYLAPATLQLLLENAIKHNVVSQKEPLSIDILCKNGFIIVKNNLNLKNSKTEGAGMGLSNIRNRYKFLSDEPVIIDSSDNHFIVRIPVLNVNS